VSAPTILVTSVRSKGRIRMTNFNIAAPRSQDRPDRRARLTNGVRPIRISALQKINAAPCSHWRLTSKTSPVAPDVPTIWRAAIPARRHRPGTVSGACQNAAGHRQQALQRGDRGGAEGFRKPGRVGKRRRMQTVGQFAERTSPASSRTRPRHPVWKRPHPEPVAEQAKVEVRDSRLAFKNKPSECTGDKFR